MMLTRVYLSSPVIADRIIAINEIVIIGITRAMMQTAVNMLSDILTN